ncbi:MAG TPA: P-loop NTPase [Legionellaceae bacterium]|nr:P-loop NTPase [Legionellaceae bacterium]
MTASVRLQSIKHIVAIASSKSGVGKSTIALNLALALQKNGAKVGFLDADIYGRRSSYVRTEQKLTQAYGLQMLSLLNLMTDQEKTTAWDGMMYEDALEQIFYATHWPELDYLIMDLPSGIRETTLNTVKKIPITGVVIITTPHAEAISEVHNATMLFNKSNTMVLGVIENKATDFYYHKSNDLRDELTIPHYSVPLLGKLIIDSKMSETAELGVPWLENEECQKRSNTTTFYAIAKILTFRCYYFGSKQENSSDT